MHLRAGAELRRIREPLESFAVQITSATRSFYGCYSTLRSSNDYVQNLQQIEELRQQFLGYLLFLSPSMSLTMI